MGYLIAAIIGIGVICLLGALSQFVLAPLINSVAPYMLNWINIPVVNSVILWGQGIAVVAAIAIRVFVGVRDGVLQNGGPRMASLGEYMFRSVAVVALVGFMPVLCNLVMYAGQAMLSDIVSASYAGGSSLVNAGELDFSALTFKVSDLAEPFVHSVFERLPGAICSFACLILAIKIIYQICKRQIEMLVLSVAAPWISIKSAMESDSNAAGELLVGLFGMCCMQWIQYLFFMVALKMLGAFYSGTGMLKILTFDGQAWVNMMMCFAVFGAALGAPQLLDRWTFIGGSSRSASMMAAMVVRQGASAVSNASRAAASAATRKA